MKVECLEVKGVGGANLKAIARIRVHLADLSMEINDMKLFQKNESYWVGLPTKEYKVEGERRFFPLVKIPDKAQEKKLLDLAREAILHSMNAGRQSDLLTRLDRIDHLDPGIPDYL